MSELLSFADVNCEQHFLFTFSRNLNNRYTVRLPLAKAPVTLLGDLTFFSASILIMTSLLRKD